MAVAFPVGMGSGLLPQPMAWGYEDSAVYHSCRTIILELQGTLSFSGRAPCGIYGAYGRE